MLKIFFILYAIVLTLSWVYAQERISDIWDITLRFCNDESISWGTKSLVLEAQTEKEQDICILLNNNWPTDITIDLNFVDWTITADGDQKKACEPENKTDNFGQYITIENNRFTVKANETIKTYANAMFPAGYAGTAYGCVTFQRVKETESEKNDQMFAIVARRANFIDIHVDGDVVLDIQAIVDNNESIPRHNNTQDTIKLYSDLINKDIKSSIILYNSWNIAAKVYGEVQAHVFWWRHTIINEINEEIILPKQQKSFMVSLPRWTRWVWGNVNIMYQFAVHSIIPWSISELPEQELSYNMQHTFALRWIILISIILGGIIAIFAKIKSSWKKSSF
jgi:hypothetical protein